MVSHPLGQIVAILPATQHHKAAFRGNWLLVYVNACCHVLFTPLAGETFAPCESLPHAAVVTGPAAGASAEQTRDARKCSHILSFFASMQERQDAF